MATETAVLKTANPPSPWVLWHRATRRHQWRAFATAGTAARALGSIAGCGEWMLTGEPMYDPNETTLAEVQGRTHVPASI